MAITISCPSCGKTGKVPDEFQGRQVKCSTCGTRLVVGDSEGFILDEEPAPSRQETPDTRTLSSSSQRELAHGWFYFHNGAKLGPLTFEGLKKAASVGNLTPSHEVLRPGATAWVRADTIRELAPWP